MALPLLTFDNLGEASELERGSWNGGTALGEHPSVRVALPRLLDELELLELRATFFIEGINCELNPDAVREIGARGHELGAHGWRHESWGELEPGRERELLKRTVDAFTALGVAPTAFRPPGGGLTAESPRLLAECGFEWCSPERGTTPARAATTIRWVPFDWELVDAYHLMQRFAPLRRQRGHGARPLTAHETEARLAAGLRAGSPSPVVILHPFLMLDEDWWQSARRLLRLAAELVEQPGRASVRFPR